MLFVAININGKKMEKSWHVGESPISSEFIDYIEVIQADCDELEYIFKKFSNIPYVSNKRVVRWFGDHAKFIVGNL